VREFVRRQSGRPFWSGPLSIALFALLTTGFVAAPLDAQILYGSIVGNVQDAQGSAIPAATVTIVNRDTNLTRETISSDNGEYTIANVLPGRYDVKVTLQGFREFVRANVPVSANQISRVEARLEVGALTETVTVESAAQLLQTDKSDVHTELKSKEIVNLPLNQYRNYQALINLVPGATPAVFQNDQTDTPGRALSTNVNGTNRNSNNTRIDGASSVNIWLPHHTGYVAPAETIDTVNISTNNFDASQGMAGGAAITLVTKSGTNNLGGSAFYFRNQDELNARQFFDPVKLNSSISIGGGTVGGPIKKDKLFYFASWEGNYERNSRFDQYTVPTAKMRNGDFSEVLAVTPGFRLFDPDTGDVNGNGRQEFPGAVIPPNRISSIAREVQANYPEPNNPGTNNGLQNNLFLGRTPKADRDNYDVKVNWNRNASHQVFAKFSTMQAQVSNLFQLGFEGGGIGDTAVYVGTVGQTWTLSPKMVFDASVGMNKQNQTAESSDFGTNFGSETFGLPGVNGSDPRQSGFPFFITGLGDVDNRGIGNVDTWTPLERHETSYTVTSNLTRLAGAHEIRAGFDFIRYQLNHWQPELGAGPRGRFDFAGNITGAPGYIPNNWNSYAAFLLGRTSTVDKSVQFEEMSGRENQYGLFVSDRWNATPNLTLNLGLRWEYYPLMSREDRGIERLDFSTFDVLLGGVGDVPKDLGIKVSKKLFAPRLGAAYRLGERTVFRAGYGITYNPLPWSRPLRGFYPLTIGFSEAASGVTGSEFASFPLAAGIPEVPLPDISSGRVPLPRNVDMRTPNPDDVERGRTQQWNVTVERQLPAEVSVSVGYVGTRTDGGYADQNLNYAESGGDANRNLFTQAGTADILDWAARTKSRYKALQVALNRPFKNGLLLKGAYTWSQAKNETDDDGWATLLWSQPSQLSRNFALAGYDRPHNFQMGFLYEIPFAKNSASPAAIIVKDWQINGVFSAFSGTPFRIDGDNTDLAQRAGQQTIDLVAPLRRVGNAGPDEPYYDPASFAQPGNKWGNTGRNQFRGPSQWNLDFGLFRIFPFGRYHFEFRAQATNVLNHTRWGNPITGFTDPNFMRIRTTAADGNVPRRVQLGVRFQF
jgi:hypothetical protein